MRIIPILAGVTAGVNEITDGTFNVSLLSLLTATYRVYFGVRVAAQNAIRSSAARHVALGPCVSRVYTQKIHILSAGL